MEARTIEGVLSIQHAVSQILGYAGSESNTYKLIANSILAGANEYDKMVAQSPLYPAGTVSARRAESIVVEQMLRKSANCISSGDIKKLTAEVMSKKGLEEMLSRVDQHGTDSLILQPMAAYLQRKRPDYREALVTYGEGVSEVMGRRGAYSINTPLTITLTKLDRTDSHKRIPLQIKRIYREFQAIEEVARLLAERSR